MIRAELFRPEDPETVLAIATWVDGAPNLETTNTSIGGIDALLRAMPVVVDDPSLRPLGSSGDVVLQPGSLEWFRAALSSRAPALGLSVRFVTEEIREGWDPAANYRTFAEQAKRLATS